MKTQIKQKEQENKRLQRQRDTYAVIAAIFAITTIAK
nr:MAG TPA: hypothetical protein [Caudoviricetes sp.]